MGMIGFLAVLALLAIGGISITWRVYMLLNEPERYRRRAKLKKHTKRIAMKRSARWPKR